MEELLAALKENNQSGVKYVYPSGKGFQAKPYVSGLACNVILAPTSQPERPPSAF